MLMGTTATHASSYAAVTVPYAHIGSGLADKSEMVMMGDKQKPAGTAQGAMP